MFFLVPVPNDDEFAIFAHLKGKVFTDFNEVRQEIEAETDRLGGKKVSTFGKFSSMLLHFVPFRISLMSQ